MLITNATSKYRDTFNNKCFTYTLIGTLAGFYVFPKLWLNLSFLSILLLGYSVSSIGCILYYFMIYQPNNGNIHLYENRAEWLSDIKLLPLVIVLIAIGSVIFFLPTDWVISKRAIDNTLTEITPNFGMALFGLGILALGLAIYLFSKIPVLISGLLESIFNNGTNKK